MFIRVTPMCVIAPLRCAAGAGDEPQERRDHAQREHREDPGLAVVVRAGDHQGARHQSDGGRRLLMLLHGDAEQLPLRHQDDERRNDGERALADHQAPERDAGQDDPGEERGGHVALPFAGATPIEIGAHLHRGRLLPAGTAEALGPDHHRPRGSVVLIEVRQDVVLDVAAVDVGEQVVTRRGGGLLRHDGHDLVDGLVVRSFVDMDRAGEMLGGRLDVFRRRLVVVARSVVHGLGRVEEPALVRRHPGVGRVGWTGCGFGADDSCRGRRRCPRPRSASPMSSSIGSSTLVSYQASSSSSSSSIVDEAGETVTSGSSAITTGSGSDGRTATCSSCDPPDAAGVSSDSQSTSRMGAKNLSRSSNRSSPPGLSSATRPP